MILENMFKISKYIYVLLMTLQKQDLLELFALEASCKYFPNKPAPTQ